MESTRGVLLTESDSNFLSNNTLLYNLNGFNIHSGANNTITWNVVSANQQTTTNYGETNVFDYNFWSDYRWADNDGDNLGDVPYLIPGTPGIYDLHPLVLLPLGHPPVWRRRIGTNYILEAGTSLAIQLQVAAAPPGTVYWGVNNTDYFFIINETLTVNSTIPVGEYFIQVSATDAYANTISMSFAFFIIDYRPPQWINIPPTVQYWTAGQILSIQFEAEDPSGIDQWVIDDDEFFTINETGFLTSRGILEENSTYAIWVSVNDTLGHATGLQFTFIVLPVRPPLFLFALCLGIIIGAIFIIVILAGYWLRWKPYL
jgi:parallel beta-helix repeat protein